MSTRDKQYPRHHWDCEQEESYCHTEPPAPCSCGLDDLKQECWGHDQLEKHFHDSIRGCADRAGLQDNKKVGIELVVAIVEELERLRAELLRVQQTETIPHHS